MRSIIDNTTPQSQDERERLLAAARDCERAAEACGTEQEMQEVYCILRHKEEMEKALTVAALARYAQTSQRQEERLPLRDEGDDFGRVEARIPAKLFYGLRAQKNFGEAGFFSDEGMKEFSKEYPQFMVKTITGKITVGYGSKTVRKPRANFGRGTIQLAS